MRSIFITYLLFLLPACSGNKNNTNDTGKRTTGNIERLDPALDNIIDTDALPEIIADSLEWSEGSLWIEKQQCLLFSDVPMNIVYKWTAEKGKQVYLQPSGYTGTAPNTRKEPGSNGLLLDSNGQLILCQHGNRQVARMDAPVEAPRAIFTGLAGRYRGKQFNSPNDAVFNSAGELFFTDPPYGLPTQDDNDSLKELPFNGVYKVKADGEVILLVDSITRPNGIAFLPGQQQLIVACSDPERPNWYSYDVKGDSLMNGRIFYSARGTDKSVHGLPDGLKADSKGHVFATGPGGIWIFNSAGKLLGKIRLEQAASNCALTPDEKTLFITNDMYILRLKMRN